MIEQVRRAYAILGLPAEASDAVVRRRYRALARQWHPDRHGGDPASEAEATSQMRIINGALGTIVKSHGREAKGPPPTHGRELSRDEIERMVRSLGRNSPVDWLRENLNPRVSRSSLSFRLAMIPSLLAWIVCEAVSIRVGRTWPAWLVWTLVAASYTGSFVVFVRVLPEE